MSLDIRESDWKVYRDMQEDLINRFYDRTAGEMMALLSREGPAGRERFWTTFELAKRRREEAATMFDDLRRSNAVLKMGLVFSQGLLKEEELSRLSKECQVNLRMLDDLKNSGRGGGD